MTITTGCWDRVEIEHNAFILGIAIDLKENDKLLITFQLALLESFKGEGTGEGEATEEITVVSNSISEASNSLLKRGNSIPNFTHCKLIVFGEEYAKKGIKNSLDFLFRESDMRRLTSVCVAQGEAKKVLASESKATRSSAIDIDRIITEHSKNNIEISGFQNIGYMHRNFIRNSPLTLAKVRVDKDAIDLAGVGVFKDYKLIGWYTGPEVAGMRFILGVIEMGMYNAELPWDKGGMISMNAYNIHTSTIPNIKGDVISIKTTATIEGDILEIENPTPILNSDKVIKDWERALEHDIGSMINSVFKKGRDVNGVDSFEIDEKIQSYYPEFWEKHKEEWEELFKTVELDVDLDVKIRRVGIIEP